MYLYQTMVEFEDIDCYGIIHHPKILYYLERTRVHFFLNNGIELENFPYGIVVREVNIKYKNMLIMFDKIDIELRVNNIDKYKFDFEYSIKKDKKTCVTANLQLIVIDKNTKKFIPIPDVILKLFEKLQ